jgi:hypothetical protein
MFEFLDVWMFVPVESRPNTDCLLIVDWVAWKWFRGLLTAVNLKRNIASELVEISESIINKCTKAQVIYVNIKVGH